MSEMWPGTGSPEISRQDHDVVALLERETRALRVLLWATHSCPGKYGDDGELQCGACRLDFKRNTVAEIEAGLQRRSLEWLRTAQHQTCLHCGVTRFTVEAAHPCSVGAGRALGHTWKRDPAEILREDATAFATAANRLASYRDRARRPGRWVFAFVVGFLDGVARRCSTHDAAASEP